MRALIAQASRGRLAAARPEEDNLAFLDSLNDDDALDYYWTHRSLGDAQAITARLRALKPILLYRPPGSKVQQYMEQASTAFLYGLFDASTKRRRRDSSIDH